MVLEIILLAIGIAGFGLAGYLDLKTTEFPDWLPYSIILAALITRSLFAFFTNDFSIITNSLIFGLGFLGFGLLLYFLKQWGDGDAWLLGALGFLFPDQAGIQAYQALSFAIYPFPVVQIFNFFFIAFIYLVLYSVAIGLRKPAVMKGFSRELRKNSKGIISVIFGFTLLITLLSIYIYYSLGIPLIALNYLLIFPFAFAGIIIFIHYGRFVEQKVFKKKISVKSLRVGDVPAGEKWRVLTSKEISQLKKKGGTIWIKEGVRFAPVFLITMLITLFYGNLMLLFLI